MRYKAKSKQTTRIVYSTLNRTFTRYYLLLLYYVFTDLTWSVEGIDAQKLPISSRSSITDELTGSVATSGNLDLIPVTVSTLSGELIGNGYELDPNSPILEQLHTKLTEHLSVPEWYIFSIDTNLICDTDTPQSLKLSDPVNITAVFNPGAHLRRIPLIQEMLQYTNKNVIDALIEEHIVYSAFNETSQAEDVEDSDDSSTFDLLCKTEAGSHPDTPSFLDLLFSSLTKETNGRNEPFAWLEISSLFSDCKSISAFLEKLNLTRDSKIGLHEISKCIGTYFFQQMEEQKTNIDEKFDNLLILLAQQNPQSIRLMDEILSYLRLSEPYWPEYSIKPLFDDDASMMEGPNSITAKVALAWYSIWAIYCRTENPAPIHLAMLKHALHLISKRTDKVMLDMILSFCCVFLVQLEDTEKPNLEQLGVIKDLLLLLEKSNGLEVNSLTLVAIIRNILNTEHLHEHLQLIKSIILELANTDAVLGTLTSLEILFNTQFLSDKQAKRAQQRLELFLQTISATNAPVDISKLVEATAQPKTSYW